MYLLLHLYNYVSIIDMSLANGTVYELACDANWYIVYYDTNFGRHV